MTSCLLKHLASRSASGCSRIYDSNDTRFSELIDIPHALAVILKPSDLITLETISNLGLALALSTVYWQHRLAKENVLCI